MGKKRNWLRELRVAETSVVAIAYVIQEAAGGTSARLTPDILFVITFLIIFLHFFVTMFCFLTHL